jgi:dethiobiotin synthetase
VTLANAVQPALVILVADAELGTINLVRLSAAALAPHRVVVYLNRFNGSAELHRRNRDWLATRDGLEIVTDPEALANKIAALATR